MKYLILEDVAGFPVPFLFPDRVDHADMREQLPYSKVLGAGYVECDGVGFRCRGGSAELGAAARPEDAAVTAAALAPRRDAAFEE